MRKPWLVPRLNLGECSPPRARGGGNKEAYGERAGRTPAKQRGIGIKNSGGGNKPRRFPVGAEVLSSGETDFRVWAAGARDIRLQIGVGPEFVSERVREIEMRAEGEGYFRAIIEEAGPGTLYKYQLPAGSFPDPGSRFQPEGPHGPSQVVDARQFAWTDHGWRGIKRQGQVIYEMHIGTFTPEGTWAAAARELPELASLGITVLELMPVAEFPGRFGWGYDGVDLFAPTHLYGRPEDFRAFVDQAHRTGLGVILDVVYNHLGPDGNYLKEFSRDYFTDRYKNEWGEPLNFDGDNSAAVREFFEANAAYWITEFHLDGLRLDATQQIFDSSSDNIQAVITRAVRRAAGSRRTYVVAENETQDSGLVRPPGAGGLGMDAVWNDDFHHAAMVALTRHNEAYYSDYFGTAQEFISCAKRGFLYQGQWYAWQKKKRGTSTRGLGPEQFVTYLQNHDQVANSLCGLRAHQLAGAGRFRALTAVLLLGPGTPMLFQGQEFAASAPFLYFADHQPDLAPLIAKGRREFLDQFTTIGNNESCLADPANEQTFLRCKLDFSERQKHQDIYQLHGDLLKLRRQDPVFSRPQPGGLDGAVLRTDAFVLRFFGPEEDDRLLLVNLGMDCLLSPAPEPLLAPPESSEWVMLWSSEAPGYGGTGTPPLDTAAGWRLLGNSAIVLRPAFQSRSSGRSVKRPSGTKTRHG